MYVSFNGSVKSCDLWRVIVILPGSTDSLALCVFIIYFTFWQKDFKTIILMFSTHTQTLIRSRTHVFGNWVLHVLNDFCIFDFQM